jgi:hypothetical protein
MANLQYGYYVAKLPINLVDLPSHANWLFLYFQSSSLHANLLHKLATYKLGMKQQLQKYPLARKNHVFLKDQWSDAILFVA